jgi:hypothetical protein
LAFAAKHATLDILFDVLYLSPSDKGVNPADVEIGKMAC